MRPSTADAAGLRRPAFPPPSPLQILLLLLAAVVRPGRAHGPQRYDHHLLGTNMAWPERYDPRAVVHSRFQAARDGRVFVVSPRYRPGVPFTLGWFRAATTPEPEVRPLPPSPAAHLPTADCGPPPSLINVIDLWLDDAGDALWLLDVGVVNTMTANPKRVAPAKVVRMDLAGCSGGDGGDSKTYKAFVIEKDGGGGSCLQRIVTSRMDGGCQFAFVSDAGRGALVAVNADTGKQWPVELTRRTAADGRRDELYVVPLRKADGRAALYATSLYDCRLFAVDLSGADRPPAAAVEVARKPYRIAVLGTDARSRMYFRRPADHDVWSWDVDDPFHPVGFRLVSRGLDCRVPVHVAPGYGGLVFALATNFGDYAANRTGSMGAYTMLRPVSVPARRGIPAGTPAAATETQTDPTETPTDPTETATDPTETPEAGLDATTSPEPCSCCKCTSG